MIWKTIPDFPNYEVSSNGQVRRITTVTSGKAGSLVAQFPYDSGYLNVHLSNGSDRKHFRVNRLVCELFNGPPPSADHHAAHKNGDLSDNDMGNLYWATPIENAEDREAHGNTPRGERNGRSRLTATQVSAMRNMASEGKTFNEISSHFGYSHGAVYCAVTKRTWRHVA
jgi:hypothetical protein